MNCTNPVDIILRAEKNVKTRRKIKVGRGQCINCKTKRAREWTNRLLDEAQAHKDVSIIVLTYNRHHIKRGERTSKGNEFYTLWPADVQKYIKRLKINMDRAYKEGKIDVHLCIPELYFHIFKVGTDFCVVQIQLFLFERYLFHLGDQLAIFCLIIHYRIIQQGRFCGL